MKVERPRSREHGDWATNVALQLGKKAGMAPRDLAGLVAERLTGKPGIAAVDVAGPGFLNVTLDAASAGALAREIVETGDQTRIRLENGGEALAAIATKASDKGLKVNLGVRPEDLLPTEGTALYSGEVEITEALGEVTLLYFKKQGETAGVVAKLTGIHRDLRHKTVRLTADPSKIHQFSNGRSLLYR